MNAVPVLVDVVRTPSGRGKPNGALAGIHPVDLGAGVLRALVARHDLDPAEIDDVIYGCVSQVGDQSSNIARQTVLAAGFPVTVPATTVDRQCGSSQQAIHFAAQAVAAGAADVVLAGGAESMSRVPLGSAGSVAGSPWSPLMRERFPEGLVPQGVSAELIAQRWDLSRDDLDAWAARSHARAAHAWEDGVWDEQVLPVPTPGGLVSRDETVRAGTTAQTLAGLSPVFRTDEFADRFPELEWRITAGSSSPLTDGAAAALVMSERRAQELGLTPRARFVAFDVIGDDPLTMLTAPIPATGRVLERAGLRVQDIDAFEVNEAFASVPLAWLREIGADPDRLNVHGGAIALGHALGSSGVRVLGALLATLERSGGRYGLQTMCEGGGMANALVIERL